MRNDALNEQNITEGIHEPTDFVWTSNALNWKNKFVIKNQTDTLPVPSAVEVNIKTLLFWCFDAFG